MRNFSYLDPFMPPGIDLGKRVFDLIPMALRFLDHGGEMGRRIRAHDWPSTPLGAIEDWPATLRTMLGVCLSSSLPTCIYWGPDLRLLYNDAWSPIPAERHPDCLGRPAREVWEDIWDVIAPQFASVIETGDGFATYDQPLVFRRQGEMVETWWNYSFTPIRDENGVVCGIFNQGNETTRLVESERRRQDEVDRLRDLFRQAPGAIALLRGPDFVFEFANDAYSDLCDRRPLIGRTLADAMPEVVGTDFQDRLREVRATGRAYRADAAALPRFDDGARTGETRLLDVVCQPIHDDSGAVADIFIQANDVTERQAALAALRESDERLQLALDSSFSIGTWDWDVANDRVTADERFARLYGVDPALAAAGTTIDAFFGGIHPDDLPHVQAAIEATLVTGEPFAQEYRLVRPGHARPIWVAAQGRARFDGEGLAVRFPGVSFDITKRREAEDAARAAAADLQVATETQAFIFRLTERMRDLDTTDAILRLSATTIGRRLGVDRAGFYRLMSEDTAQFLHCWHNDRLPALTGTVPLSDFGSAAGRYRAGETLIAGDFANDPDLRNTWLGSQAGAGIGVPLRRAGQWTSTMFVNAATPRAWSSDDIALVEAVAETTWDAVERAQAVMALRDSEEKFRAIANSIDQMVWSTLPDGYHDYYNERWYEYTGVPAGSTDGDALNALLHPDDQERAWSLWRRCLASGDPYRIEYRLRHRTGAYRWVLGSAASVRDANGRITRWFGTCTDIQEIVEAREVLATSRAKLEEAIEERTRQLMAAEEQLRQAQKMEAVGQLTGGIAHDFNNMLAVVIGALDLLERRVAQGRTDVARYVEAARDGATRAAQLTQRLLSFSRQSALALAIVDVGELTAGMIDLLVRTIGEAVAIDTDLAGDLWLVSADRSQLENAIINLAVNARDAMPRGGRLTIATRNVTLDAAAALPRAVTPGDYVQLTVRDTGTGMEADVAAKAFDPFFTTKSVGKGTGLGLSQVFGFVRQSGGHVAIDTTPGQGTTVAIVLPRDAGVRPVDAVPVPAVTERRGSSSEIILVVEDDDRVRNFSVEALRELGYTVVHAHDGEAAIALIDAGQTAHLLFTDMVMPGMNGRELADVARARLPGLRVLYTSGYTRDAVQPGGSEEATLLRKPFDVATLAARIRSTLDA